MPINVTCAVKLPAPQLNLGLGQQMHYRITATGDVTYKMRDHGSAPFLRGSGAGVAQREWPTSAAEFPRTRRFLHSIGMRIAGSGSLRWEVEVHDADGALLTVVKDCTYTNESDTATRLDLVEIDIVGAEGG